ncbi:MAG: YerC/YecD family TrpR-related protein, partial [Oscillospiraceae bacterium]
MNSKLNESDMEYLYKAILSLNDIDECKRFFTDLCTVPELKALSQRLQVAKMLNN